MNAQEARQLTNDSFNSVEELEMIFERIRKSAIEAKSECFMSFKHAGLY